MQQREPLCEFVSAELRVKSLSLHNLSREVRFGDCSKHTYNYLLVSVVTTYITCCTSKS